MLHLPLLPVPGGDLVVLVTDTRLVVVRVRAPERRLVLGVPLSPSGLAPWHIEQVMFAATSLAPDRVLVSAIGRPPAGLSALLEGLTRVTRGLGAPLTEIPDVALLAGELVPAQTARDHTQYAGRLRLLWRRYCRRRSLRRAAFSSSL